MIETIKEAIEIFGAEVIYKAGMERLKGNKELWEKFFYPTKSLSHPIEAVKIASAYLERNSL